MPSVRIHGSGEVFEASPVTSLLNVLLANRFPIETLCGGHAECARCAVRIHEGPQFLSPVKEKEKAKLSSLSAEPEVRLACQVYTRGDVEIEVLNRRKLPGGVP